MKSIIIKSKEDFYENIVEFQKSEIRNNNWRCCINCFHVSFESKNHLIATCKLVNIAPPAIVIATGCEQWEDQIPF